tara:strand:+ start:509 stop:1201 length:693 start_codon:yes stop_codon:yes gene_type:complete
MTKYAEVVYPEDKENVYPQKLIKYLYSRFYSASSSETPKILDVGCCTGKALRLFSECGEIDLYGIDVRDEGISDVTFKTCNLENQPIPFPDDFFEFIYSKSVLEHVRNTDNFLNEVLRVLKPGGIFVCLAPDWKSQMHTFYNDYTHVKPFTRKGLQDAMMINGFKDVQCEYFYQLPFIWKYPFLKFVPKIIAAVLPDTLKWKDAEQRNTKDRKLIRFSKELMLLAVATKM